MLGEYDIWFRDPKIVLQNQLANPDFKDEFDYAPFQKFNDNGKREWKDLMSANWVYQQAVRSLPFHVMLYFPLKRTFILEHYCGRPSNTWRFVCPGYLGK